MSGITCIIISILLFKGQRDIKSRVGIDYIQINSTIHKIVGVHRKARTIVYVKYLYDGIEYIRRLGYWTSNMRVGDMVKVLVDKNKPSNIVPSINIKGILSIVFLILGICIISIGIIISALIYS